MVKVDLKPAYSSVKIDKDSQRFTGLKFALGGQFVYMHDIKLPLGSRLVPADLPHGTGYPYLIWILASFFMERWPIFMI